jgi:uncharacterized membrane protein YraQ (UPF0718 family)/copper chaperone CopZ
LTDFINAIWGTVTELAPSLFLGLLIAGVLHTFVKRDKIMAHLGKPGFRSALKASIIGVPLPLCSCGVLPAAIGLRRDGASMGAATSFLASTPQTGVDSIIATWGVLGWPVALTKVVAAFVAGVVSGTLVDLFPDDAQSSQPPKSVSCTAAEERGRAGQIWDYAFGTIFRDIYRWLLIGIIVSGLIMVFVEPGSLSRFAILRGPLGLLAALAIGIPLYVCSLASIPVAAALVYAGFPVGGALVFLMAGPATNAATMGAVWKSMGSKVFWIYLTSLVVMSLLAGLLLNNLKLPMVAASGHDAHGGFGDIIGIAAGALLTAGILWWGIRDIVMKITVASGKGKYCLLAIEGMGCISCVNKVRDALRDLDGILSAHVSLDEKRASISITDGFDIQSAVRTLEGLGYTGRIISSDE